MRTSRLLAVSIYLLQRAFCFHIHTTSPQRRHSTFFSTPFEAGFYDANDDFSFSTPTAVPPNTRLVLGLTKYSHDVTLCAADAKTGNVLFALSKERLTRRKHDSGNTALLVEACLEALDLNVDSIQKVVMNNHHHRILPIESTLAHMEWEAGLHINGGSEDGYEDEYNVLQRGGDDDDKDNVIVMELSHHLAHAYSTAAQAPFDTGLVLVADGMGETYRTMLQHGENYVTDFSLLDSSSSLELIPSDLAERAKTSIFDWREAESVYTFRKTPTSLEIRPIFKRFTAEHSPPTLYNHGFENMDSVGAVYSRASSHIFGDWNACGKVMGLAPWMEHGFEEMKPHGKPILTGRIQDGSLSIDRTLLSGTPLIARNDPDLFSEDGSRKKRYDFDDNADGSDRHKPSKVALEAIAIAHRIQVDTETVLMDFCKYMKEKTGENNLCLCGGVALNSVLNGRLSRELGFEQTFVSPYPGDDGIAVGCCAFGLFGSSAPSVPLWKGPLSPYLGPEPSDMDIKLSIEEAMPWLEVESIRNEDQRLEMVAEEIASGGVVAWYRSRSEIGPRALGHRSILADPRKKDLVRFINEHVKSRESFRPFAPSVLVEEAANWFDLGSTKHSNVSPYMSMTAMVHNDKRAEIPAVTHVDGSSRLQTVTPDAEPLYHKLISKFFALTGVPMVLNTSFNTLPSEPIVESPSDAIRSFLYSMGAIEKLVLGDYVIRRKKPDLKMLLGEASKSDDVKIEPTLLTRAGPVEFQSTFELEEGRSDTEPVTVTKVRMPGRPMHSEKNEWFELLDELEGELLASCDGQTTLNEIMTFYTVTEDGQDLREEDVDEAKNLLQNIVRRLVRLYEHTLIYW